MTVLDPSLKRNILNGFYRGQVLKHCSNGKCKVWIPGVYVEEAVYNPDLLPDAEQAAPLFGGSSNGSGIYTYPRINAVVWCFFQNGDQNLPVYFASCNGGPEASSQYTQIGPDGKYESFGKEHDHIIDVTDKISDAEIHTINVSKGSIRFYEDGSIQTTVTKTNPLGAPYNVNLPYSQSHHVLNTLSTVIFPGAVTDPMFVSDSPYNYHTNDVVSGLNNASFGISCNINMSPGAVFNEITSSIGKCCIKGYKTQCRYVYAKQGSATKKNDVIKPIYIEEEIEVIDKEGKKKKDYIPVNYHWEMFRTICDVNQKVDNTPVYQITQKNKITEAQVDGVKYKVGDKIRISKREIVRDITKALVYKVKEKKPQCMVLIAAEDCAINKWDYILSSGYDLFLCSPSQFGNPVQYFDKKFDDGYNAQCPNNVWPPLVDPKVAAYKASIILMEDRRKYSSTRFNKNGTLQTFLSDSYDESYFRQTISATGDIEGEAFKQDYQDWNKTHNYYQGQPVQAIISGYNAAIWGFSNDDQYHNGVLSLWNYQVRQHVPKSPAEWWYYNNYLYADQHNGICALNNNLSITFTPQYWKEVIGFAEHNKWPRWDRKVPIDPFLREQISCGYVNNVNIGENAWNYGHLSNFDMMSYTNISTDYHGNLSIEQTNSFDMFITDVKHAYILNPLRNFPWIRNEWTHLRFNREGELSVHGTKFMELSVTNPYDPYKKSQMQMAADGKISVYNTDEINIFTVTPQPQRPPEDEKEQAAREAAWPPFKPGTVNNPPFVDNIEPYPCGDETKDFSHVKMTKSGVIELDSSNSFDIFCAEHQKCKKDLPTRAIQEGAECSPSVSKEPRSHAKFDGVAGTIKMDCCNDITIDGTHGTTTIMHEKQGDFVITTPIGNITITTQAGNMMVDVNGNVDVKCTGNLNAKVGGTTTVDSAGAMTLKAPTITLDGDVTITKTLTVVGAQTNNSTIVASDTITDSGCTLATHVHPYKWGHYPGESKTSPGQ